MNCLQVRENLVAYLDGEVTEGERAQIEAHLEMCPDCTAALERLRALQAGLLDVVPAGLDQVRLSPAAGERIRDRLRQERTKRFRGPVLARLRPQPGMLRGAIALMVTFFVIATAVLSRPAVVSAQELVLIAPQELAPDTDAALRILVREAGSTVPVRDAEIQVRLLASGYPEQTLYRGRTDKGGTADVHFHVPDYGSDKIDADLVVTTGAGQVRHAVTVRRSFRVYLTSDKPLYQPGQTVHQRVLALESARSLPASTRSTRFVVQGPHGIPVCEQTVQTSVYGIASSDCQLSPEAAEGTYRLIASVGDTVSERAVTVGRYERPSFRVTLNTDDTYYLPNQPASGQVSVTQFDESPIPGAQVRLRATLETGQLVLDAQGRTDERGVFTFALITPGREWIGADSTLRFEASATAPEGGTEWTGRVVPLAAEPLAVDVVAEGGKIRPGIENRIAVLTARPDGTPTQTSLEIVVNGETLYIETDAYGLAECMVTPPVGVRELEIQVTATGPVGEQTTETTTLSADRGPAQVLLRLDRATYEVGESLHLEVLSGQAGDETIYVDITRHEGGQALGTYVAHLRDGRAQLDVDVSAGMAGTIEVHAYQVLRDGTVVRDTRLAVVDAPTEVMVAVHTDRERYRPEDRAAVTIETRVDGQPVTSALGIAVVDESVFALEERAPGFAKLYFLLEASLLEGDAGPRRVALPGLLDPPSEDVRSAQDAAARASWAEIPTQGPQAIRGTVQPERPAWAIPLAVTLGIILICIPLGLWGTVLERTRNAAWPGKPLRRTALVIVGGSFVVFIPAAALAALVLRLLLASFAGLVLLALMGIVWLLGIAALAVEGWRAKDQATQWVAVLIGAYGILGTLLGYVAERGADLGAILTWAIVALLLPALGALLLLASGLWVERRRLGATLLILLVLLTVTIAVFAGLSLALSSHWALAVSDPMLYAGPVGWLTGCAKAGAPATEPQATQIAGETVVETVVVEKEVEHQITKVVETEATEVVKEQPATPTPAAMETPVPATTATPAPTRVPVETLPTPTPLPPEPQPTATREGQSEPPPPLLGQYIPETLLWVPEHITDGNGQAQIVLEWPALPASWRVTVLASTRQGEVGEGTALIHVDGW